MGTQLDWRLGGKKGYIAMTNPLHDAKPQNSLMQPPDWEEIEERNRYGYDALLGPFPPRHTVFERDGVVMWIWIVAIGVILAFAYWQFQA
jgi:hypothetical protein